MCEIYTTHPGKCPGKRRHGASLFTHALHSHDDGPRGRGGGDERGRGLLAVEIAVPVVSPNQQKVDRRSVDIDRNEQRKEGVDDFGRMTRPTMNETRRDHHHSSSRRDGNNRHSRDDISRSWSRRSSRDTHEEKRKQRHSESDNRCREKKNQNTTVIAVMKGIRNNISNSIIIKYKMTLHQSSLDKNSSFSTHVLLSFIGAFNTHEMKTFKVKAVANDHGISWQDDNITQATRRNNDNMIDAVL